MPFNRILSLESWGLLLSTEEGAGAKKQENSRQPASSWVRQRGGGGTETFARHLLSGRGCVFE
jgi:hypothetical protein